MGTLAGAPKDPAFWLHHATVDLIFNRYLQNGGRVQNASMLSSECLAKSHRHEQETMFPCHALRTICLRQLAVVIVVLLQDKIWWLFGGRGAFFFEAQ